MIFKCLVVVALIFIYDPQIAVNLTKNKLIVYFFCQLLENALAGNEA